jgi:hypothetical protein
MQQLMHVLGPLVMPQQNERQLKQPLKSLRITRMGKIAMLLPLG